MIQLKYKNIKIYPQIVYYGITIFLFLFYIIWSKPISILSKELTIVSYHIIDHNILQLAFIGVLLWCSILFYFYKKNKKVSQFILWITFTIILFSTIISVVMPYSYGGFEDNLTFTTQKGLLKFSIWYYFLDVIILLISAFLIYISIQKNVKFIFFVLFIYYTISNIAILSSTKVSSTPIHPTEEITISKNHPNVLLFILDTVGSQTLHYYLTNDNDDNDKSWTKDFTFFDNVVALSTGGTLFSLPSMLGGYNYSPQQQYHKIVNSSKKEITNSLFNIGDQSIDKFNLYSFANEALENTSSILDHKIDINYRYIGCNKINDSLITYNPKIPILAVSIYENTPYILRRFLVSSTDCHQWQKSLFFSYKWLKIAKDISLTIKETTKPNYQIIHTLGLHLRYIVSDSTLDKVMVKQLDISISSIKYVIKQLKEKQIYNNTKIIIATDHGHYSLDDSHKEFFERIVSKKFHSLYNKTPLTQLDGFILQKDFNTIQEKLTINSKLLSSADVHASTISSFTNIDHIVDYTKDINTHHKNTVFNIPFISWQYLLFLVEDSPSKHIKDDVENIQYKQFMASNNQYFFYVQVKDKSNFKEDIIPTNQLSSLPIIISNSSSQ